MGFLEDLFENFFDRRNRHNSRGSHKTGYDHHNRQRISSARSTECNKCGVDNPIENKFCHSCGSELTMKTQNEQGIYCDGCGARNQVGSKFCQACGSDLTNTPIIRQNCQSSLSLNAKFCPQCGQSVGRY
ncbi:MAG: hypothetical protein CL609_10295 [Anaerolineaceae bacterium]|nr:hypothetical protein [Anaerolineaceae bacterium]